MAGPIRPIRNDAGYRAALSRIDALMDARPGSRDADELEVLATLVDRYEAGRFPIDAPDPVTALLFRMEQAGLARSDLEPMIGTRARVSEVLTGRRTLTLAMIRALHQQLGIPAASLIGAPPEGGLAGVAPRRRRQAAQRAATA